MNKKGDIPTLLFVIVALFAIGVIVFTISHFTRSLYGQLDSVLDNSELYNNSEAHQALNRAETFERSIWDYVFLAFAIGYILMLALFAYSTRINNVFFWLFTLCSLFGLFIGVVLSNTWEAYSSSPEFATTLATFPITNAILGHFYPIFVTAMIALFLVMLFGKFGGGDDY